MTWFRYNNKITVSHKFDPHKIGIDLTMEYEFDYHPVGLLFNYQFGFNIAIQQGGFVMRSSNNMIILSIVFFVFAAAFSVVFWEDVSWAAKIGLFLFGFGSGVTAGRWLAMRSR